MKICLSSEEEKEELRRTQEIDKEIKKDKELAKNEVKMLLLGSGESGKSTILKQMTLIHGKSFTDEERIVFKANVFSNIVLSMRAILDAMAVMNIVLENLDSKERKSLTIAVNVKTLTSVLPANISAAVKGLWADAGVIKCYERAREYQLTDSAKYFFDAIDRIAKPDYVPTDQDILRSRSKTIGIVETSFLVSDLTYRMFDVAGQRSERKKWIHCFENVTAVLFLAACSEYDQVLQEDVTVNRISDSLHLFSEVCNSRWFQETSMILFFNKVDLFKEKITKSPLGNYFPEYTGPNEYEPASQFLVDQFLALNENPDKSIFTHFTCATDTSQVKFVMEAVHDIIVNEALNKAGVM